MGLDSAAEIKSTVFSMPLSKAPGPDGYTAEFFQASWSIIGPGLTTAI